MHRCKKKQLMLLPEHAGESRQYSIYGTLFLLFGQQTCQKIARMIEISHLFAECMDEHSTRLQDSAANVEQ